MVRHAVLALAVAVIFISGCGEPTGEPATAERGDLYVLSQLGQLLLIDANEHQSKLPSNLAGVHAAIDRQLDMNPARAAKYHAFISMPRFHYFGSPDLKMSFHDTHVSEMVIAVVTAESGKRPMVLTNFNKAIPVGSAELPALLKASAKVRADAGLSPQPIWPQPK